MMIRAKRRAIVTLSHRFGLITRRSHSCTSTIITSITSSEHDGCQTRRRCGSWKAAAASPLLSARGIGFLTFPCQQHSRNFHPFPLGTSCETSCRGRKNRRHFIGFPLSPFNCGVATSSAGSWIGLLLCVEGERLLVHTPTTSTDSSSVEQQNHGARTREELLGAVDRKLLMTWWFHNRDVVLHAIQNGRFADDDNDSSSPSSLGRFQQVYGQNVEYHDLFIIAQGQQAVRYSFELIALFWNVALTKVGDLQIINEASAEHPEGQEGVLGRRIIIVRVPFRVNQKLRLLPFLVFSEYNGWVELHLICKQKDENDPSLSFEIGRHDDRMAFSDSSGEDILRRVMKTPILGTSLYWFRRGHGELVQFLARFRWSR
jgi:hypothetical protein